MKTYEIITEVSKACAGAEVPDTKFEEKDLVSPGAYVKSRHPKEFDRAVKEDLADGGVRYTLVIGAVTYKYVFNEI